MSDIKYLNYKEGDIKDCLISWQKKGLSYTASGYGNKIPTTKKIKYGNKLYRIYCYCYSNSGTCYIVKNGEKLIVRDYPTI
jgi:hypothetical protein